MNRYAKLFLVFLICVVIGVVLFRFSKQENNNDNKWFEGEWQRTGVLIGESGTLKILNQTEDELEFRLDVIHGANSGMAEGKAKFTSDSKAVYTIDAREGFDNVQVIFEKNGDDILVSVEGDRYNLGLGHGTALDGTYTKGEPTYLNANIEDEVLINEQNKNNLKALVGEEVYENIISAIKLGDGAKEKNNLYRCFLSGIGVGVDLLIKDEYIYCLYYYAGSYSYYTNDEKFAKELPEELKENISDTEEINYMYQSVEKE